MVWASLQTKKKEWKEGNEKKVGREKGKCRSRRGRHKARKITASTSEIGAGARKVGKG